MGYFVAYRHTGADPQYLSSILPVVCEALRQSGEVYCTFFDEAKFKTRALEPRQIMKHAFDTIEKLGCLFVLIDGPDKSDGQLMEVGFCIAKNIPFVVAKREGVTNTYVDTMATFSFTYSDNEGLIAGIKQLQEEKLWR